MRSAASCAGSFRAAVIEAISAGEAHVPVKDAREERIVTTHGRHAWKFESFKYLSPVIALSSLSALRCVFRFVQGLLFGRGNRRVREDARNGGGENGASGVQTDTSPSQLSCATFPSLPFKGLDDETFSATNRNSRKGELFGSPH